MIQNQIAKKYSQALFSLAEENNEFVKFKEELNEINEAISEHDELRNVFFHPRIEIKEKKKILEKIFSEKFSKDILNFLNLLIDKRRIFYIEAIIEQFNNLVNKREDILEVEVVSAIELEEKLQNKLEGKLEDELNYEVILKNVVDPEILGGLILKIGDKIIDGSIQNELNTLKDKIEKIPVSKLGVE